jgi:hypothetical protein
MAKGRREFLASIAAPGRVYAESQTFLMKRIGEVLHAGGETLWVGDLDARGVAPGLGAVG